MVAPVPKTKAVELLEELYQTDRLHEELSEFRANKYLREITKLLESKVDIANLWICKGFVYSLSNRPKEMHEAFLNARRLGAIDSYSRFNQATQYLLHGYFNEAVEAFSLQKNSTAQEQIERIALSTFAYSEIEKLELTTETREKLLQRKKRLKDLGIDIDQAHQLLSIFFDFVRKQKVRFGLVRYSIVDEEEYYLHFEAVTSLDVTHSILNEFDQYIAEHSELYDINLKINIILTPISSILYKNIA
ncbi:hypothetical protein [Acinetobacter sp. ANC 4193]